MFTRSAQYYDSLYWFKDYGAACRRLRELIQQFNPRAESLLDVACGTGKHAEVLQAFYQVEGLDINPQLLQIARRRCPGVQFHEGNMIEFELNRRYDVITCLFSSIAYVKHVAALDKAVACMASHLAPAGLLFIEPWFGPETYWVGKITTNFVDEPELKIAWMYTSRIEGTLSVLDINYLVGTPGGVKHFIERHELGLFSAGEYLSAFEKAGLKVQYDSTGLFGRGLYIGRADGV